MEDHIPDDLLNKILLKLPVKDLHRFKWVCKSWYSLITSPAFVTNHLEANQINLPRLLAKFVHKNVGDYNFSIVSRETLGFLETHKVVPYITPIVDHMMLLGSCNGVVCLWDGDKVVLWNPATSDAKIVLNSLRSKCVPARRNWDRVCHEHVIGFGFDAKHDDYKVVLIHNVTYAPGKITETPLYYEVEVYNLKTDSSRLLAASFESRYVFFFQFSVKYTDGMCSWLALMSVSEIISFGLESPHQIISFDFRDEVIISTPLPHMKGLVLIALDVLDGSLALINHNVAAGEYNIWVLGEYGVEESWTKLVTVSIGCNERPLGFWRNCELLIETKEDDLVLFELNTRKRSHLSTFGQRMLYPSVSFRESLVPLGRVKEHL